MTLTAIAGGDGEPVEPDWSSVYADELDIAACREHWGIVIRELKERQILTAANGHMVERLVRFRVEYERAARDVAERGTVLKAARTKVPQQNPYWSIMRQAGEEVRVLEVELGIPPVRRAKAGKVERKAKVARASDAYLKQVPR